MTGDGHDPLAIRIRLPYATEDEFIEKYGTNVARGGMFVATRAIKPEGTALAFELILAGGERLLRGEGVVVKAQIDPGGTRSGMTVQFVKLDGPSKALVDRVVSRRSPNESPTAPPSVEPVLAPEAVPAPAIPAGPSEPRRRRSLPEIPAVQIPATAEPPPVLGIDFGVSACRAALFRDGRPQGATIIPSVVYADEQGHLVVGTAAKAQLLNDPKNTVFGLKRLLGRRMRSRAARELAVHLPFGLVADAEGDVGIELRGAVRPVTELAAALLRELRTVASEQAGAELTQAVLCAPACFDHRQRAALLASARQAGFEVLRLIQQTSAAALAFGHGKGLPRRRTLVYDLGGGTFDAAVVELTGDDVEVVAAGGDGLMGGFNFDLRVAAALTEQFTAVSPTAGPSLRDAAERAKIALDTAESTPVEVPSLDIKTQLTRAQLESLTSVGVERTLQVVRNIFATRGIKPDGLDEVLLLGRQGRTPFVRRRLEEAFGKSVHTDLDAEGAVASGAALFGHALVRAKQGKPALGLSEILTSPIGICMRGGAMRRVLDRNTPLPAEKSVSFPLHSGEELAIATYQGDGERAEENEYLGAAQVKAERAGDWVIHFEVSADGTLELTGTAPGGKNEPLKLATPDAGEADRAALLSRAPAGADQERPAGLFRGIRKLFGRA
jgi:molecular chaperone DnaK